MLSRPLIKKIIRGRCLALVGSGLSCEIGYPSWDELAHQTRAALTESGLISATDAYERYLRRKNYPAFFRQVERDLDNDRESLTSLIRPLLIRTNSTNGPLYDLITKWPFAGYLTTNYDDEIQAHLTNRNEHFTVVRNRRQDFFVWRDGVTGVVQKLHSDLDHPDEVVLTTADYQRLYVDNHENFRDALCNVFSMFDVFIIGHSLSDPDINFVLQLARTQRSPQHPIYMVAAGFSGSEEQDLFEQYNIELVRYSNSD